MPVVQLYCAPLPFIGAMADHYWFVITDEKSGACERWEVWQSAHAGGVSFGHVHCNLKPPEAGVGGGPARLAARWDGEAAGKLAAVLKTVAQDYPYRERYLPWPGPNSNTFVAWVLRAAGIEYPLHWKAHGQHYGQA